LVLKGCMNLRGLLEFVEDEAKRFGAPKSKPRPELWQWILNEKPKLVTCITSCYDLEGECHSCQDSVSV